jgi:hypothetical protein
LSCCASVTRSHAGGARSSETMTPGLVGPGAERMWRVREGQAGLVGHNFLPAWKSR